MGSKVTGVKIKGIGKYVPEMVATNEDFTKIVETSDEWITQRTCRYAAFPYFFD